MMEQQQQLMAQLEVALMHQTMQGGTQTFETLTMTGSGTAASANVANGIAMSSNGNLAI